MRGDRLRARGTLWRVGRRSPPARVPAVILLALVAVLANACGIGDRATPQVVPTATPAPARAGSAAADTRTPESTNEVDITVDTEAMQDAPCHAMGTTIMGRCSEEDVDRLSAQIRARLARAEPTEDAPGEAEDGGYLPGAEADDVAVAGEPETIQAEDGDRLTIDARIVRWEVDGRPVVGYGYNGQVPGPFIRVPQGSRVEVDFGNQIDQPTTIHWHGLRHDNSSDGVPGVTQPVVLPGHRFTYHLAFPDAGLFWFHPHVREDIQQDAGMVGAILVTPSRRAEDNPVDREEILVLDDFLLEEGQAVPYGKDGANFAIMGRFGNRMLVNGRGDYELGVSRGDVVRFYVVNVANARPFRLSFDGARMRLVGSDLSHFEREDFVDSVVIAPAERYVVEVMFDEAREYRILNTTPDDVHALGHVVVAGGGRPDPTVVASFDRVRRNAGVTADIEGFAEHFDRAPDVELVIDVDVPDLLTAGTGSTAAEDEEVAGGEVADDHGAFDPSRPGAGIEWEDEMMAVNRTAGPDDVHWMLRDPRSGAENHDLAYAFRVGDAVRIRIFNDPTSDHPMQHPIHIHGQRFVVLSVNGREVGNRVWKDTVLVPAGATVELLMDVTNPGVWMVHCHIAEHLDNGMMFQFVVTERAAPLDAGTLPTPTPSATSRPPATERY